MNRVDKHLNTENDKFESSSLDETLNPQLSGFNIDDDKVVFVPAEEIRAIESIFNKMEQAQQEFRRVAEELRNNVWR
jgi:hypothetical protein